MTGGPGERLVTLPAFPTGDTLRLAVAVDRAAVVVEPASAVPYTMKRIPLTILERRQPVSRNTTAADLRGNVR
jgi:hypothetical protein